MEPFDPFAVLGLSRRYDVDSATVQHAYLEKSAALHPDAVGTGTVETSDAEWASAELNRAKQIMDDPEQRAIALWKLLGGGRGTGEEDKSLPPGFLMQMMEVREELEAAQASGDAAQLAQWEAWAEAQRAEYQRRVAGIFALTTVSTDPIHLRQIKAELNAWRYVERMMEQI